MQHKEEHLETFFEDSWQDMQGLLSDHFPDKKKRKKKFFIWWLGMSAAVIGVGLLLMTWNVDQEIEENIEVVKNKTEIKIDNLSTKQLLKKESLTTLTAKKIKTNTPIKEIKEVKNSTLKFTQKKLLLAIDSQTKSPNKVDLTEMKSTSNKQKINNVKLVLSTNKTTEKITLLTVNQSFVETKTIIRLDSLDRKEQLIIFDNTPNFVGVGLAKTKKYYAKSNLQYSRSNFDFQSVDIGLSIGYQLRKRLFMELGIGVGVIQKVVPVEEGVFFSTAKDSDLFEVTNISDANQVPTAPSRLGMIRMPLSIGYQLTPRWSGQIDMGYIRQFETASLKKREGQYFTSKNYLSIGGSVLYTYERFGLAIGYENWSFENLDHHIFAKTSYRLFGK